MDTIKSFAGPVATIIGSVAPIAGSFLNKPKTPAIKEPKPVATPVMPTKDDGAARAAALKEVAKRASSKGRASTNLYEKETLG